jgi:pterin binding enzyme
VVAAIRDRFTFDAGARGREEMIMTHLQVGTRRVDLDMRVLVMGILNRTHDSFYDRGAYWRLDDLLHRANRLVDDGADLLDIGAFSLQAAGLGTGAGTRSRGSLARGHTAASGCAPGAEVRPSRPAGCSG